MLKQPTIESDRYDKKRHSHEEQTRLRKGPKEKMDSLVLIENLKLHEQVSKRMHF